MGGVVKAGFTLIELLVYMAIMGFIIVVAGRVFSDSTDMRIRTQNMIKTAETVNAVSNLIKEDLGRMGAKEWKEAGNENFSVEKDVYMHLEGSVTTGDTSSYRFGISGSETRTGVASLENTAGKFDEILFRTMDYNEKGESEAVREIRYSVDNASNGGRLERQCRTLKLIKAGAGTSNEETCPKVSSWEGVPKTLIATNVITFSLNPSKPGISASSQSDALMFPPSDGNGTFGFIGRTSEGSNVLAPPTPGSTNYTNRVTLKNFQSSTGSGNEAKYSQVFFASSGTACHDFTFMPGETYFIEFNLPYSEQNGTFCRICMFQPGEDHIAVGLREKNEWDKQIIPDFAVYPPQISESADESPPPPINRYQEFSVPERVTACIVVTFAFRSPNVSSGQLTFQDFKVGRKTDEVYHFAEKEEAYEYVPPSLSDKRRVKAFELELATKFKNEIARSKTVIPVPNNGILISTP